MILRSWRGRTRTADAEEYVHVLRREILPELEARGSPGAYILRRDHEESSEFWVLSLWESMEAIRGFAGPRPERAVVPAEAQRLLLDFDPEAQHHEVLHAPGLSAPPGPSRSRDALPYDRGR